ncbi:hypothetical protein KYC_05067 [Achromobacter arsenitoxydans SY8]|uniref:Uncharacterized protein n=2 Tax=Achromobacter TaxID=222 RepID=H0F2M5_9BURK|nr:hypothetical protein KYC_05067 [Achromobacter arsenitoxydans SY8]
MTMSNKIRVLCIQPSTVSARFAFLAIALKWSIGATPRPSRLRIGPHDLEPEGSEAAFWQFALRHAFSSQSILVTRGDHWDVSASVDGDEVHAFGRKFALRQCLF